MKKKEKKERLRVYLKSMKKWKYLPRKYWNKAWTFLLLCAKFYIPKSQNPNSILSSVEKNYHYGWITEWIYIYFCNIANEPQPPPKGYLISM